MAQTSMKTICTLPTRWLQNSFRERPVQNSCVSHCGAAILSAAAAHVLYSDVPKTAAEFNADPAMMLEAYRHVEAASVSDAIEQILHEKRFMSHRMQAIFPTKFAGRLLP